MVFGVSTISDHLDTRVDKKNVLPILFGRGFDRCFRPKCVRFALQWNLDAPCAFRFTPFHGS